MQTKVRFLLIVLILFLSSFSIEAANIQVRGYLSQRIYYTPYRLLDGGATAYLVPEINVSLPTVRGYVQLGELYASSSIFTPTSRQINFTMRRAYATIRDPIFPIFDKNFLVSIGDVSVNYSPYTLRLDGSEGNPLMKGITVTFPASNDFTIDGCFLWDTQSANARYSYIWGSKVRKKMYGMEIEGIYVSADEWEHYEDPSTKEWSYKRLKSKDVVWSLNGKKRVNPNLEFDVLVANNHKLSEDEKVDSASANLIKARLTGLGGLNIDLSSWNFGKSFDPKYRDQYRHWNLAEDGYSNLVDRYQGKFGLGFNISGRVGNIRITRLGHEHYIKSREEVGDLNFIQLTLTGKKYTYSGGYSLETRNYVNNVHRIENQKLFSKFNFAVERNLNFGEFRLNSKAFWEYGKDNIAVSPTKGIYVNKQGLTVATTIPRGLIRGASVNFTVQRREFQNQTKLDLLWNISYSSPRGLRFNWRGAYPKDSWYAGKHLDYIDNLIRISHVVYF